MGKYILFILLFCSVGHAQGEPVIPPCNEPDSVAIKDKGIWTCAKRDPNMLYKSDFSKPMDYSDTVQIRGVECLKSKVGGTWCIVCIPYLDRDRNFPGYVSCNWNR